MFNISVVSKLSVTDWLVRQKLESCQSVLTRMGYNDKVIDIILADDEKIEDLIKAVDENNEILKPKKRQFKRRLDELIQMRMYEDV